MDEHVLAAALAAKSDHNPGKSLTVGSTGRTGVNMLHIAIIAATLILALIGLAAFVTNRALKWLD
jgi:hypothetical protein